ncbi:hypothetical protein [Desulfobulbus alkaliphilus]|uniref:hypothetical protein n=1 Tax=Desulfobulbus alkaliphilus TaxID=869814 RepID=UPI001963FB9A|nr:hypothetical protein [Desulfobulbus alkaliphilus]MBM9535721.1 hypothetical protein [Desulfobulbus alkaliphilus]
MTTPRPSLIVLGASGGVAQAFLQLLPSSRAALSTLYLVDKTDSVTRCPHVPHARLNYRFIEADVNTSLSGLLAQAVERDAHVIVLDLTDQITQPILHTADLHGVHYINCSLNAEATTMTGYLPTLKKFGRAYTNGAHMLSTGMNPGIINHMVLDVIKRYGVPESYVEFEYDSAFPAVDPGTPFITWSKRQFLAESVIDYSGYCGEGGKYQELDVPAIVHPISMEQFLRPILSLDEYPLGMIVPHDEIISLSQYFGIPGQFVYAVHPLSLERLRSIYAARGTVQELELTLLNNIDTPLQGSDTIGVWLKYRDYRVGCWCQVFHKDVIGTNATLYMVAVGVLASLLEFLRTYRSSPGVSSVDDLNTERLLGTVKRYMQIHERIEDIYPYQMVNPPQEEAYAAPSQGREKQTLNP